MSNELKPCPFCGGEAKVVHSSAVYVTCTECGCRTRQMNRRVRVESQKDEERRVEELAVKAWNRRANDEQADC